MPSELLEHKKVKSLTKFLLNRTLTLDLDKYRENGTERVLVKITFVLPEDYGVGCVYFNFDFIAYYLNGAEIPLLLFERLFGLGENPGGIGWKIHDYLRKFYNDFTMQNKWGRRVHIQLFGYHVGVK